MSRLGRLAVWALARLDEPAVQTVQVSRTHGQYGRGNRELYSSTTWQYAWWSRVTLLMSP